MRAKPFSRPTLIAAVELLEGHSQARFNQMVLRLSLEDEIDSGTAVSVAKKCDMLGRIIVQRSDQVLDTLGGSMTLGEAVVREAIQLLTAELRFPPRSRSDAASRAMAMSLASTSMVAIPNCGRPYPTRFSSLRPTTRSISFSSRFSS